MKLTRPGAVIVMLSAMAFPAVADAAQDRPAIPGEQSGPRLEEPAAGAGEDFRGPRSGGSSLLQLADHDPERECGWNHEVAGGDGSWECPEYRDSPRERELERERLRASQQNEAHRMRMRVQRNEIARQQQALRRLQEKMRAQREAAARQQQEAPADLFAPQARAATKTWMERNGISPAGGTERTLALMVQTALVLQDFDPGPKDGKIGRKTLAAIAAFQLAFGLLAGADLGDVLATILHTAMTLQGLDPGPADKLLGSRSRQVAKAWRDKHAGALSSLAAASPAQGGGYWGAIAYSRTRDGWSAGGASWQTQRASAVAGALKRCRKSKAGGNCTEILVFQGGCGALAVGRAPAYGAARGRTRSEAERNALSQCRRAGTDCRVRKKLTTCNPAVAPDHGPFEAQPLSDFHVTVPTGQREVELCVRDHECEDGDRISVTVNGAQVFSGELYNSWSCQPIPVQPGANPVSMFAINGTGFKGNCSHADANTGEIRVTGSSSATQSWRHRGGAGSNARIVVQVE